MPKAFIIYLFKIVKTVSSYAIDKQLFCKIKQTQFIKNSQQQVYEAPIDAISIHAALNKQLILIRAADRLIFLIAISREINIFNLS